MIFSYFVFTKIQRRISMPDIRTLLNSGRNAQELVNEYGRDVVISELQEMAGDDMADVALRASLELGDQRLIALASRVVLCGSYPAAATRLAAQNNFAPDLWEIRRKILRKKKK